MAKHLKDPLTWLRGLLAAFITGGSTAIVGGTGWAAAHGVGLEVPVVNLKVLGIMFVSSGVIGAAAYLKQSPLPEIVETSEITTTVTSVKTVATATAPPATETETKGKT